MESMSALVPSPSAAFSQFLEVWYGPRSEPQPHDHATLAFATRPTADDSDSDSDRFSIWLSSATLTNPLDLCTDTAPCPALVLLTIAELASKRDRDTGTPYTLLIQPSSTTNTPVWDAMRQTESVATFLNTGKGTAEEVRVDEETVRMWNKCRKAWGKVNVGSVKVISSAADGGPASEVDVQRVREISKLLGIEKGVEIDHAL